MTPSAFANAVVLTGPTGSGKSELAVELAERMGAEIVSMDSMAIYRGMDIGTAKPGPDERRRVPHHLLDVLHPWESASVAWWLTQAAACCRDIEGKGKRVLIVGGTALYLKSLLCGLFQGPPADEALRRRLADDAERLGHPALHARLARVDPASAARLHPNDLRRVVRALEVYELTGRPLSGWQTQWSVDSRKSAPSSLPTVLWLDLPRAELYARIDARVGRMIEEGLVEEVHRLRQLPRPVSKEAAQALGYKELFAHLDGKLGLDEALEQVRTRSRNFAKRQITWFRNLPGLRPVGRELTFAALGLTMRA